MTLSFAIIGCGKIAKRHAEQIARVGKLIAVCDVDFQRAQQLATEFNSKAYHDISELLAVESNVDVVCICTPNYLHTQQTILSLNAGKHVLCEKPLAINTIDAENMIQAAELNQKKLFVVKSSRYTPVIEALKKQIDFGALGKIYSFQLNCVWNRPNHYYSENWRGTNEQDGGTLFTQFSHYIDVLLWLLNDDAESFSGLRSNLSNKDIDFEDTGAISVKMKSGTIGSIHYTVNAFSKNQEVSLSIVAENATIKLGGEYMQELLYQMPEIIDLKALAPNQLANDYGAYKGSMSNHNKVYDNLILALNGKESKHIDGNSALKTVTFIEKIYQQIPLTN
jgi:predicted dehydrogenase